MEIDFTFSIKSEFIIRKEIEVHTISKQLNLKSETGYFDNSLCV